MSDSRPYWSGLARKPGDVNRLVMGVRIAVRPRWWPSETTIPFNIKHRWIEMIGNKSYSSVVLREPTPATVKKVGKPLPKIRGFDQWPVDRFSMLHW